MPDYDRPSQHGAILGRLLARLAAVGRWQMKPVSLPECCLTCAFREGTLPNQTAATVKQAFDCVVGIDKSNFACHHGLKNGEPTRPCVGYLTACAAPFAYVRDSLSEVLRELDATEERPDDIRAAFDRWIAEVDPEGKMDEYQQARAYAKGLPT